MSSKFFKYLLLISFIFAAMAGCSSQGQQAFLGFPATVAIDSAKNRVFIIDNQLNEMNLLNAATNTLVLGEEDSPLLDNEDALLLPAFPNDAALASLPGGVSRLFVIGGNNGTLNQIVVLDYDDINGLVLAPFSPITGMTAGTDVLGGVAVNTALGQVFVSDSTTGQLHVYSIFDGSEDPNSPLMIGGIPGRLALDPITNILAVSNADSTLVSLIDTQDLTLPVQTLDVGLTTRDLALASNGNGTLLFLSGSMENISQVYRLDLVDLTNSFLLFEFAATPPTVPVPSPNLITGTLNQVAAGNLSNGEMAAFFTQSSGDLLVFDVTPDLTTLTPTLVSVGAVTADGIDLLTDINGDVTTVYYASPNVGTLTLVDPLTNLFTDQIQ